MQSDRTKFLVLGVLLLVLAGYSLLNIHQLQVTNDRQSDCILSYTQNKSETDRIRSEQVVKESQATREVIQGVFSGKIKTPAQFAALGATYNAQLAEIDRARDAHPVRVFDPEKQCGISVKGKR